MSRKMLVIGIDGLEPSLVDSLMENGRSGGFRLFSSENTIELESTFPPDTSLAWPSIYTGMNPYQLGLRGTLAHENSEVRAKLRGKTFWDYVGKRGKFSCVINPAPIFPSWPIKGRMITANGMDVSVYPESTLREYRIPRMNYSERYPSTNWGRIAHFKRISHDTGELFKLAMKMLSDFDYDVFFVCFQALDYAEHYLWRFADNHDPAKPLINPLRNYLMRFYEVFDGMVREFIDKYGHEYTICILGDHGHGSRPGRLFSLNEFFRRSGILIPKDTSRTGQFKSLGRSLALEFSYYAHMDWIAYKLYSYLVKRNPGMALSEISQSISVATRGDFGKQYGSIIINEKESKKREDLTRSVTELLGKLDIVEYAVDARNLYGNFIESSHSEILVKLNDKYGFQHGYFVPLIQRNFEKRIISGGHLPQTRLMLWPGPTDIERINSKRSYGVCDVAPSILEHFGTEASSEVVGRPIWKYP